ncbi:MAG: hypothetical protein CVU88_00345 [Firmicutes bacterium HGW-Firmicutes-13]|nr:MAG: hypothetical protein CVU88_00345 [Firmicutes bacterium HGW-Firmicutes-13]
MTVTDQVMGISLLLLFGYLGGQLAKKIKLPAVAGYCLMGCLLSPSIFNVIPEFLNYELSPIKVLGLSTIALIIGGELHLKTLKKIGTGIIVITFVQIFTTLMVVFLGIFLLLGGNLSISLILGAMATATAPAATVAVIKEYKAKGKFTSTLLGIIALDDAVCIIFVGLAVAVAKSLMEMGSVFKLVDLAHPVMELFGSIILGIVTGILLCFVLKNIREKSETIVVLLGFILLNSGLSEYLNLSALLVNMVCGAAVTNIYIKNPFVINHLDDIDLPIFVIFFTLAGTGLHLDLLFTNWLPALVYIITRAAGKLLGCYYGAKISRSDSNIQKYLGLAMLPKAGVSIGLILFVQSRFPGTELSATVTAIELAAVTFYEIIGPVATRYALIGSGEVHIEHKDTGLSQNM